MGMQRRLGQLSSQQSFDCDVEVAAASTSDDAPQTVPTRASLQSHEAPQMGARPSIRQSAQKVLYSTELDSSWSSVMRRSALKILTAPEFDYVLAMVIFVNMVIMILETDQQAKEDESAGNNITWMTVCGWIALVIFILEMLLRLCAFQSLFWKDAWNVFDFIVVALDAGFAFASLFVGQYFPVSALRIFRLAKLGRVTRALRIFPELRLLVGGMVGALRTIFWGLLMLVLFLIVWGIAAVLLIYPLAKDMDPDSCAKCPEAYDSVFHAALTFFQQICAGDAWAEATVPIIQTYPVTILFFLPLFMTVGLAVMNLILGVVVDTAMSTKAKHEEEDKAAETLYQMDKSFRLLEICQKMVNHKSGSLSLEAVLQRFNEPGEFQDALRSMDITGEDLNAIWTVIDSNKIGSVPYQVLVNGIYSMRESEEAFMLASIKHQIALTRKDLLKNSKRTRDDFDSKMHNIENYVKDMAQRWQVFDERKQSLDNDILEEVTSKSTVDKVGGSSDLQIHGSIGVVPGPHTSIAKSKNVSWFFLEDHPHERCNSTTSTSVKNGKVDAGDEFSHDINTLKIELQDILFKIDRQVSQTFSLMSQKTSERCTGSTAIALPTLQGQWPPAREGTGITSSGRPDREDTLTSLDSARRAARGRAGVALLARNKVLGRSPREKDGLESATSSPRDISI